MLFALRQKHILREYLHQHPCHHMKLFCFSSFQKNIGHVSFRQGNGSLLIKAFLDATDKFPRHHIEDIMTAVRYELSTNPKYEDEGKCQIAVSENTLTKLFYL